MQDLIGTDVEAIGFSMSNVVQNFSGENAPSGRFANLGISYICTYDQFKEMLAYVRDYPDRTVIPSISASFDQATGLLKGSLNYKMFYLTNTGKEYEEIPPTGIEKGVDGIFYSGDFDPELIPDDFWGGSQTGIGEENIAE